MKYTQAPLFPIYENDKLTALGLTKREYFALEAMKIILARPDASFEIEATTEDAVKFADGLLNELAK